MKKVLLFILLLLSFNSTSFGITDEELLENGVFFFQQGLYQSAIERFTELIERDPKNAEAFKNRGIALMGQKKYDLAIQDFESAISISSELKDLYINLGVAWYYKEDCEKAIHFYSKEIDVAPDNTVAYFNRALCLADLGRIDPAFTDVNKTLELQPKLYEALCLKADLLVSKKEYKNALLFYEEAISVDPQKPYAKKRLKIFEKKLWAENQKSIEKIASQDGEDSEAKYAIQVGAFRSQANAENRKNLLKKKGYETRILTLTRDKKPFYMVRVGSYQNREEANRVKDELKKKMGIKSVVRPYGRW